MNKRDLAELGRNIELVRAWPRRAFEWRQATGRTQEELATAVDVHPGQMSKYLNAKALPEPDKIERVENFFKQEGF